MSVESRCSPTCPGPGPDVADRGPNPEDAIEIPCTVCGRRSDPVQPGPAAHQVVAALTRTTGGDS